MTTKALGRLKRAPGVSVTPGVTPVVKKGLRSGAGGEDRTPDLRFTKPLHYRCATPAAAPGLPATRQSRKRVLGPDRHDRQSKKRAPPCGALQIVDPLGSARLLSVGGEDI